MSLRKKLTTIAITAGVASCAFASQAAASAKGIEPFRVGEVPTPFGTYPIPSGELDHGITGQPGKACAILYADNHEIARRVTTSRRTDRATTRQGATAHLSPAPLARPVG